MTAGGARRLIERCRTPRGWLTLALIFNLPFVIFRAPRLAFDTYVHLFLADHYRARWWQLWEPRWYLGFSVASYPPLAHQLIALLSWPLQAVITAFAPEPELYPGAFRWLGEEAAYVLLLLAVLCFLPLAVRAFARVFVGPRAADGAALLAVFLPAAALAAWTFGQLPTLMATTLVLLALARGAEFARGGRRAALWQAVALAAAAGATHHGIFLFVPFGGLAVLLTAWRRATPRQAVSILGRVGVWAGLSAGAVAVVLWPFLAWSQGQALQTPIDHASRYNFILQPQATLLFFWPIYGPLLLLIPALPGLIRRAPRLWPLALTSAVLFVLGLGGTTPLPRWLFGAGWEWLTYDRFGLWAAISLLPMAGAALMLLWRSRQRWGPRLALGFLIAMAGAGSLAGWLALVLHTEPPAVDLTPIVRFLDDPAQRPYRYLTLGFGDQFAKLTALTDNGTLDGAYHTARELPELRASGLGALDGAVWNPQGVAALRPFLANPQRYGLRWVFSNHPAYLPLLHATGWQFRFFVGDVMAWEQTQVTPQPLTPPEENRAAALWWGLAPLTALALTGLALTWPLRSGLTRQTIGRGLSILRSSLWIVTLCSTGLWWVHVMRSGAGDLPRIYWLYQSVVVYASEAALSLTLMVWLAERWARGDRLQWGPRLVAWAGAALIGAVALSTWASADRALSVATALRLGLLAGAYLLVINEPAVRAGFSRVLAGIVLAQCLVAGLEVATQNTAFLHDLFLPWPGALTAATRGASVVANAEGVRWLRAYGTWPHPNLLGALLDLGLAAALGLWLTTGQRRWLALIGLSAATLVLTFSRGAWLGAGALFGTAWLLTPRPDHSALRRAALVAGLVAVFTALPLAGWITGRLDLSGEANALEHASILERTLLVGYSLQAWRAQPWTGVGAGAFVQWAARAINRQLPFEPVHNVPLLILAETGLPGAAAALALFAAVAAEVRRRRPLTTDQALWTAALAGALVVGLFDHLWWTQPPAQFLLAVVLALCSA